jgi:hypothetical protein
MVSEFCEMAEYVSIPTTMKRKIRLMLHERSSGREEAKPDILNQRNEIQMTGKCVNRKVDESERMNENFHVDRLI